MTVLKHAVATILCLAAGSLMAATEGTDYVVLDNPLPNAQGKLTKVFSYDCPFCFKYDVGVDPKIVPRVQKELNLPFNPMHLETKATYGRLATEFFAMCLLKDRAAGTDPEDKNALFQKAKSALYFAYHKKGERWSGGEEAFLKTLTDATGISAEAFSAARKDPKVLALCEEWKASYDVAKIQGIPAYVVNGRYLIMTKNIRGLDQMFDLIKELKEK